MAATAHLLAAALLLALATPLLVAAESNFIVEYKPNELDKARCSWLHIIND